MGNNLIESNIIEDDPVMTQIKLSNLEKMGFVDEKLDQKYGEKL